MSTPAITDSAYSAISADRAGFESKYQWTEDNCAMCQSVGPWPALDKTLHRSGCWGSVVHQLLHGTIDPPRASRIAADREALESLAALRKFMVYCNEGQATNDAGVDETVQRWAEATGLLHEASHHTQVDQLRQLYAGAFSEEVLTQVFNQIMAAQDDYEHRLSTFVSQAVRNGELEQAMSLPLEAQSRKRTVQEAKLDD